MTSPPGGGSCTRPKRASIGPARRIEARMRAHNCGSSSRGVAGRASTVTAFFPVHSTVAPRCVRRASIVSTSRIRGTLSSRQGPSASSVAARMGRAAFLLPAGRIVPWSGRPPETQNVDAMGCGKLRRGLRRRQALANVRGVHPLLALALLAVAGLAATRVPWPRLAPRLRRDAALAPGLPLLLVGLVLGPGIGLLDRAAVRALTPVTALAVGCLGAALGARLEWRLVKRIPRGVWLLCGTQALAVLATIAASAWAVMRAVPALRSAWSPILPLGLTLGAVAVVSGPVAVARAAQAPRGARLRSRRDARRHLRRAGVRRDHRRLAPPRPDGRRRAGPGGVAGDDAGKRRARRDGVPQRHAAAAGRGRAGVRPARRGVVRRGRGVCVGIEPAPGVRDRRCAHREPRPTATWRARPARGLGAPRDHGPLHYDGGAPRAAHRLDPAGGPRACGAARGGALGRGALRARSAQGGAPPSPAWARHHRSGGHRVGDRYELLPYLSRRGCAGRHRGGGRAARPARGGAASGQEPRRADVDSPATGGGAWLSDSDLGGGRDGGQPGHHRAGRHRGRGVIAGRRARHAGLSPGVASARRARGRRRPPAGRDDPARNRSPGRHFARPAPAGAARRRRRRGPARRGRRPVRRAAGGGGRHGVGRGCHRPQRAARHDDLALGAEGAETRAGQGPQGEVKSWLVAAAAAVLALALFPGVAHAWTPGTHIYLGESVLANLHQLPALVAAYLRAFPFDLLYGKIAADTSIAKKYAPVGRHCHAWHVGQEIFDLAHTDALRAFGLGYLSHLAADTVAHNFFVPRQLVLTSTTAALGHSYWESRFETHLGDAYAREARDLILQDHGRSDAHLDEILSPTLFSVRTSRRLFRGMVHLTESQSWQWAFQLISENSRWDLPDADVERHMAVAFEYVMEALGTGGGDAAARRLDPAGASALGLAKRMRRQAL